MVRKAHFNPFKKDNFSYLGINGYKKPIRIKIWRTDVKEHAKIHLL